MEVHFSKYARSSTLYQQGYSYQQMIIQLLSFGYQGSNILIFVPTCFWSYTYSSVLNIWYIEDKNPSFQLFRTACKSKIHRKKTRLKKTNGRLLNIYAVTITFRNDNVILSDYQANWWINKIVLTPPSRMCT